MIRAVLFDIDGTLIFTGGAGQLAFDRVLASEFGFRTSTHRIRFGGRTDTALVREIFLHYGVEPSPANFARFFESYVHWLEHLLHESVGGIHPGVGRWLHDLQALPHPPLVGLLTGNTRLGAEIKLRHFELWDSFRTGGFGDDHEERRRIAVVARSRAVELLGDELEGDEILVIGDTPLDIDCAAAIGARTLAVATGASSLDELRSHRPTWAVKDLEQVGVEQIWSKLG